MYRLTLILLIATLLIACISTPETIVNRKAGYSFDVLPGWEFEPTKDSSLSIMKIKGITVGTIKISSMTSEYNTLDESIYHYTYNMTSSFQNASKVGSGISEIDGRKCTWYRMRATAKGIKQEVLIYNLQTENKLLFSIICIASENAFSEFEEDFIKMVYSFRLLNNHK